jgi:hypothetical protein
MTTKTMVWIGLFIGSTIGGYLPAFFGASVFSGWSILGSTLGGALGIWAGYRFGVSNFGE